MWKFQVNVSYLITASVTFSNHFCSQNLWDSLAGWCISLFVPIKKISGLFLHSITSYLPWCNFVGTAHEKHRYNGEEKRPCGTLMWHTCDGRSVAIQKMSIFQSCFTWERKITVSREGGKEFFVILQTLSWQYKIEAAATKLWNSVLRAVTQSPSLL